MEQQEKRVGVFTRIYRNENTMYRAIDSVLKQTYQNFKFYILVNHVTKGAIVEYVKKDARIEIIDGNPSDGFKTCAKNIAKENEYVTTIDADDYYDETYIEQLVQIAEKEAADIVACSYYFFQGENKIVGIRKEDSVTWEVGNTNQMLHHVYGHFRTVWGKLISSKVLSESDFNSLPASTQYGGYGGDTMFMFNLFLTANKLSVTDKMLYYYQMSETSDTYKLSQGRLDSDEVVFEFVEGILKKIGVYGEEQRQFLLLVYGYALIDTVKLVMNMNFFGTEKAETLIYIFTKRITKEIFIRAERGWLNTAEPEQIERYIKEMYNTLFSHISLEDISGECCNVYMEILQIIYPKFRGVLSIEEFRILFKSKKILDAYVKEDFCRVFEMLTVIFKVLSPKEERCCLNLMRCLNTDSIVLSVLHEESFVKQYPEILRMLNGGEYEQTCHVIKNYFSKETLPNMAEVLLELWNNLAAKLENASDYILSKQLMVELLVQWNEKVKAKQEFDELLDMGIDDDNMRYLKSLLIE